MADQASRYRKLEGKVCFFWKAILMAIPITGLLYILSFYQYFQVSLFREQYIGLFLALMLAGIFMGVPAGGKASKNSIPWYDWILSTFGMVVGFYLFIFYPKLILEFGNITPERIVISFIAVLLIVEALRRLVGWILVSIVVFFFAYAFVAPFLPGPLQGQSTKADQLLNFLFLDSASLLSMLGIAATTALAFILFGQTLLNFKGGDLINDICIGLFGKFRGGPAKTSVVGSTLVGSISGGPVTNVMLTGNITIPLMIKNKHSRVEAGAIESVASTGGQIMPPVMGIAAFVIAENLGVPYAEVALAALVPAILYYLCIFTQIDLKAAREGITGISKRELPPIKTVGRSALLIVPVFGILVYFLFILGYPPTSAAVYSSGLAVFVLLIQKEVRRGFLKRIITSLEETGKTALEIGVILGAAGLIIGIMGITGLGSNLVLTLTRVGEFGLPILLIVSAVVSIILGMGMPSVAAYTLVAVLVAPAMVELGVVPIAAHLFVFYFAIVSNFTPPIALASFAAAPIAKASPHKISFRAMRFGLVAYAIPFIFVYSPNILLGNGNNITLITLSIVTAILSTIILSAALVGYMLGRLNVTQRILLIVSAICLLIPVHGFSATLLVNVAGFILALVVVAFQKLKDQNELSGLTEERHIT